MPTCGRVSEGLAVGLFFSPAVGLFLMYHGGCLVGVLACILCVCSFWLCVLCCGWVVFCAVFVLLIYRVFCVCPLPLYSVCIFGR